jgi:Skp family chaperone for outer membrane proteins
MKKILLVAMLLFTVGVFSQTKSSDERAELQFNKISSSIELTDAQSAFLLNECKTYQENVTNLRKEKDSMEEEEFHERMKEYRLSFYSSFKGQLNNESKLSSWDKMNRKLLEK